MPALSMGSAELEMRNLAQAQGWWKGITETHLQHCRKASVVEDQYKGPIRKVKRQMKKGWGQVM